MRLTFNLKITLSIIFLLALFISSNVSWADKLAPNKIYAKFSKNQKYYIVFISAGGIDTYRDVGSGVAFEVKKGPDKLLWQVDWYSKKVYLCNNGGNLVRIGPWAENYKTLNDLAIAFYNNGRLIKSYKVTELVNNRDSIQRTASHYFWMGEDKARAFGLSKDEKEFSLTTIENQVFTFDVRSGEIIFYSATPPGK